MNDKNKDDVLKSLGLPPLKPLGKLNIVQLNDDDKLEPYKKDEAFAKVFVDPKGYFNDPNFETSTNKVNQIFQEDDNGVVVPFNEKKPYSGPTFALLPLNVDFDLINVPTTSQLDSTAAPQDSSYKKYAPNILDSDVNLLKNRPMISSANDNSSLG